MLRINQEVGATYKSSLGEQRGSFSSQELFEFVWSPLRGDQGYYALELEDLQDPEGRLLYYQINMRRTTDTKEPGDKIVTDYDGHLPPGRYTLSLLKQGRHLNEKEATTLEAQKFFKMVASLEFEVRNEAPVRRYYPSTLRSYSTDRFSKRKSLSPSPERLTPQTPGKDLSARSLSTPPTPGKGLSFMETSPFSRQDWNTDVYTPQPAIREGYETLPLSPYSPFRPSF